MKRRISRRRVKIILARIRKRAEQMTQFEPKDDFTLYCLRRYMSDAQTYYGTHAFLFPRQTVNTLYSTI